MILYNAACRKHDKHLLVLLPIDKQWKKAKNNDLIKKKQKKNLISYYLIDSY